MMRMTVLASGSKGNSTIIASRRTRILVDAGLSARELIKRMRLAQESPESIDALLITHEHQDHVQGVAVLARKMGIPVYFTEATHRAWMRWMAPKKRLTYAGWLAQRAAALESGQTEPSGVGEEAAVTVSDREESGMGGSNGIEPVERAADKDDPCALPSVEYFNAGNGFSIGDVTVTPFTIPHDAADPVGFVFEAEGVRIGMATDLGYLPSNVIAALRRCDVLMIESNHDLEMLRDGPYPWQVKQRVMSRVGHLSNDAVSQFLETQYDGYATHVVLAHLSEKNNLPELARVMAEKALQGRASLLANKVLLANQDTPLDPVCL